ncbi:MAG: PPOX class F420-dependent oxidoreductase [Candidatus Hodarchaeales archaeon]|jgi:PPOX class probable F420-dependent enzyme
METIPKGFLDLFEKISFGILSTIMPDGSPHTSVVWVDHDDDYILFNSITDRQKYKNIKINPLVSLVIIDPDNSYRYIEIRGKIVAFTTDGAERFVDNLAVKYLGVDRYPHHRPGVTRVIYKLKPKKVFCYEN